MGFIEAMRDRSLVAQITHEEDMIQHLATGVRTGYVGFDPTADSLHVGHLLPIMTLSRWQRAGHRAIAVMGGGTAMVGDPTGKTDMRRMITVEEIENNIQCFRKQVEPLLDFSSPAKGVIINNADWLRPLNYLDFLREIGSQFSVNRMLTADCFKSRLEKGLSFLEFNYMLLQAYDFLHLFRQEKCTVQLGGDDQWSNILAGADLIRRFGAAQVYCMTTPLLTTPDGRKMGKTESGAVWLDPNKTSPYDYFQFWRNVPDSMVGPCLRYFTFLEMGEIRELEARQGAALNQSKEVLAHACTAIVHGQEEADRARTAAQALFSGGVAGSGNEPIVDVPRAQLQGGVDILEFLANTGICESKTEARRLVTQGGLLIEGEKISDIKYMLTESRFGEAGQCLLRKGKKHYYRLRISD